MIGVYRQAEHGTQRRLGGSSCAAATGKLFALIELMVEKNLLSKTKRTASRTRTVSAGGVGRYTIRVQKTKNPYNHKDSFDSDLTKRGFSTEGCIKMAETFNIEGFCFILDE